MNAAIPEWVVLGMLTVIGTVAWWGIQRIVSGMDGINSTLLAISERLAQINGRVGKVETRLEMHESQDADRQAGVEREHTRIWTAIDRGRLSS